MMKKLVLFSALVMALIILYGCGSSDSDSNSNTQAVAVITADRISTTHEETETVKATDIESTANQSGTIPEETEPVEYVVHVGDSIRAVKEALKSSIDREYCDAVVWKDSTGYHVACAGEDEDTICATAWFSDDLELLEAEGLKLIEPITQMEEWLGKTEEEFIALYGPCHYHRPNSNVYTPAYISKDGTVYWMELAHGMIVSINWYTLDNHYYGHYKLTTSGETELPEYEVHIGDPIRTIRESLGDSVTGAFNAYVAWNDSKGNHIACTGDDWERIYAIVSFSDDLELLEAEGLEPIEPITQMEEWLGKTEDEFVAMYGPYHFQPGSGNYMPSYISKNGIVYYLGTVCGTIVSIHSFAIDGRFLSVYYTYP